MREAVSRSVLPDPGPAARRPHHLRRQGPGRPPSRRSSRCARRPARRTSSSSCSTTSASAPRSAFGGPVSTPTAERLAADGLKYTRFHTTALCSPTRAALLTGPQPPRRSAWAASPRSPPRRPGYSSLRPEHLRAAGRDAEAQRLRHRAVRQVPRGAGLGDQPDGPVRQLALPAAAASSTSTASSAARPTSTPRRSTTTPRRSSPTAPPRRATTSPRT